MHAMVQPNLWPAALLMIAAAATSASHAQIAGNGPAVFNHQALYVRDLPESTAFYETVVGLKRIPDPFNDNVHVWLDIGHGVQLHLIGGATAVAQHHIDVHMAFAVPSVDAFVKHLDSLKIRYVNSRSVEGQVTTRPDGIRQVYFQDPDGYWIEVNDARKSG
jgi:lactoylglutathione lyase